MNPRVLVDLNVLLDVLTERQPDYVASAQIWDAVERGEIDGVVSADCFTALYYILRRLKDRRAAKRGVQLVYDVFEVLGVDGATIRQAIDSPVKDFEDAVQYHCAERGNVSTIITRDIRDFKDGDLLVLSPEAFLAQGG